MTWTAWCARLHLPAAGCRRREWQHTRHTSLKPMMPLTQVRDTDMDRLEQMLYVVAHGDAEAAREGASPAGMAKLLRVAQLAVEYLLYVQDTLSGSNSTLEARLGAEIRRREVAARECQPAEPAPAPEA